VSALVGRCPEGQQVVIEAKASESPRSSARRSSTANIAVPAPARPRAHPSCIAIRTGKVVDKPKHPIENKVRPNPRAKHRSVG
jgi:hypothetical protein